MTPRIEFTPKIDIPAGFILVQDSREKKPLFKSQPWIIDVGLKSGDYSVKGFEDVIVVERKSIADLLGTLGKGRGRFERELNRLENHKWKGLLIEGMEKDIYQPNAFSGLHPNSLYHSLSAIETKWGLHVYYAEHRKNAKWWVLSRLTKLYKYLRDGSLSHDSN